MKRWRISTVSMDDLEPILAIEKHSFQCPWGRISFEGELSSQNALSYVVKSARTDGEEQIIAYAFLRRVLDELHILKIAVVPARRGEGIATWILNSCFTNGSQQGLKTVYLEVRPSNNPAVALYEKLGFRVTGRRPDYYADSREDALIMTKNLKEEKWA